MGKEEGMGPADSAGIGRGAALSHSSRMGTSGSLAKLVYFVASISKVSQIAVSIAVKEIEYLA